MSNKYYTEEYLIPFAEKFLIWRPQRYVFTEHAYLCYIEEYNIEKRFDKARFMSALMTCLRQNRGKICSIPENASINSPDTARGVSPDAFAQDNGYSSRALMHFDWANPKQSKYCVDGPGFMNTYLETRYGKKLRRAKSKPLYFLDELNLEGVFTEEGAQALLSLYKEMRPDIENYGHNNNIIHVLAGLLHFNLQLLKDNKLLHKKLDDLLKNTKKEH